MAKRSKDWQSGNRAAWQAIEKMASRRLSATMASRLAELEEERRRVRAILRAKSPDDKTIGFDLEGEVESLLTRLDRAERRADGMRSLEDAGDEVLKACTPLLAKRSGRTTSEWLLVIAREVIPELCRKAGV